MSNPTRAATVLTGTSADLCVEAHLREFLEQGFEVAVVRDATAAAMLPEGDGYLAAITNFRYMANALWTTGQATNLIATKTRHSVSQDEAGAGAAIHTGPWHCGRSPLARHIACR